ncbi:MAG: hypothetical protein ACR2PX_07570 [Endozoicomonas sp.]|uniref:hypothetical protein n=1 Tax=Endozoicomonas sp. TaxID=1892382 RepID=UPI003D9AB6D4
MVFAAFKSCVSVYIGDHSFCIVVGMIILIELDMNAVLVSLTEIPALLYGMYWLLSLL